MSSPDPRMDQVEEWLRTYDPVAFDSDLVAFPKCIEGVLWVEDNDAWRGRYPSLDAFYAAWEVRHPDVRYYAAERRAQMTEDIFTDPGGLPSERLARWRGTGS